MRPATEFDDVCTMVGPKRPDANVCWCLSYRLSSKENRSLTGKARGAKVKALLKKGPLGVLAYEDDEVVGWAAVAPRAETSFATNRKIPHVDDLDVWSVWCIRVRPGHRRSGLSHHLLQGAVDARCWASGSVGTSASSSCSVRRPTHGVGQRRWRRRSR